MLLGTAAGDVVAEDPAPLAVHVVAGEERHHGETLHGHRQIAPDHRGEPVRLALQGELGPLDLLEVLKLQLEELDHLHGQPGRTGDTHRRVLVGREDLLDVALRDHVAHGRPPVTGQDDAAGEGRRDDRGAVRRLDGPLHGRQLPVAREHPGRLLGQEVHERRGPGRQEGSW